MVEHSDYCEVGTSTATGANLLQVNSDVTFNAIRFGRGIGNNASNIAIGEAATSPLAAITTGVNSIALGTGALDAMTIGNEGIAIGTGAFSAFNRTSDSSTPGIAIGVRAGQSITTGYPNYLFGHDAGSNLTTGGFAIMIGNSPAASANNSSDEIVIGTRSSTGKGSGTGFINPNTGGVYQGNNSSSWATTSDQRIKKNIVTNEEGLEKINQIRVVNFEYRLPEEIEGLPEFAAVKKEGIQMGVIAQELQEVCPDCVKTESTGVMSVDTDNLTWHLINAVKQLSAQNATLEARLLSLESA